MQLLIQDREQLVGRLGVGVVGAQDQRLELLLQDTSLYQLISGF